MSAARRLGGGAPTLRSCAAAAALGFALDQPIAMARSTPRLGTEDVGAGTITLIVGGSGSGKSTLLAEVEESLRESERCVVTIPERLANLPAVDLLGKLSLSDAMGALSRAGLAEVGCLVRRPGEMSEGQRYRLRLAMALERARGREGGVLVIDEFAGALDELTARGVAVLLRRFVDETRCAAVVVSARADAARWLRPERTVRVSAVGGVAICDSGGGSRAADPLEDIRIGMGTREEYESLSGLHYRAGAPAAVARILSARHVAGNGEDCVAGVLVVTMAPLNARWRELTWPGRYSTGDRRENARRINEEVRRIARVIVEPRFRGLGVARELVRAYLREPLTPCVEALAAMGCATPFFERAGMRAYATAPSPRDARLLDALAHLGIEEWRLATPGTALRRAMDTPERTAFFVDELKRWAGASRATKARAGLPIGEVFREACRGIACKATAYAWTAPGALGDFEKGDER